MVASVLLWLGIGLLLVCAIGQAHTMFSATSMSTDQSGGNFFGLLGIDFLLFVAAATAQYIGW